MSRGERTRDGGETPKQAPKTHRASLQHGSSTTPRKDLEVVPGRRLGLFLPVSTNFGPLLATMRGHYCDFARRDTQYWDDLGAHSECPSEGVFDGVGCLSVSSPPPPSNRITESEALGTPAHRCPGSELPAKHHLRHQGHALRLRKTHRTQQQARPACLLRVHVPRRGDVFTQGAHRSHMSPSDYQSSPRIWATRLWAIACYTLYVSARG